jgi:hypothetical protein
VNVRLWEKDKMVWVVFQELSKQELSKWIQAICKEYFDLLPADLVPVPVFVVNTAHRRF